jgi:hypothetical protein
MHQFHYSCANIFKQQQRLDDLFIPHWFYRQPKQLIYNKINQYHIYKDNAHQVHTNQQMKCAPRSNNYLSSVLNHKNKSLQFHIRVVTQQRGYTTHQITIQFTIRTHKRNNNSLEVFKINEELFGILKWPSRKQNWTVIARAPHMLSRPVSWKKEPKNNMIWKLDSS